MTDAPSSAAEAERKAEQIRKDLGGTINQLKDNLRPSQLAHEAYATTRAHTPDWLVRYWIFARSPAGLALIGAAIASLVGGVFAQRQRQQRQRQIRLPRQRRKRLLRQRQTWLSRARRRLRR